MKDLYRIPWLHICLPQYLCTFCQLQMLGWTSQKAKADKQNSPVQWLGFCFCFWILNSTPQLVPLPRGYIYQGILWHWEYCSFQYIGYLWDIVTHIASKSSGEVWGHPDFWVIESSRACVGGADSSQQMFVWLVRKSLIKNCNTGPVVWSKFLPTAAKYTSFYN